jgi:hypothetical protein
MEVEKFKGVERAVPLDVKWRFEHDVEKAHEALGKFLESRKGMSLEGQDG